MASRILLLEDSPTYAKLARLLLQNCGFRVEAASTADEGLRIARATPPDLILIDMHLAGMDGLQALTALKAEPGTRFIPAIALTADRIDDPFAVEAARRAGFVDFVEKPTNDAAFRDLLAPFLGRPMRPGEH